MPPTPRTSPASCPGNYTIERRAFEPGDMEMKPFWRMLFEKTGGKISVLCIASDYLGEAPYIFSHYCMYNMPTKIYFGQFTFRSVTQIVNNIVHTSKSYPQIASEIASGQYSGFAYVMIADFGLLCSFFTAFFFGIVFAGIEKKRLLNRVCSAIYPAVKVICFFAPVFYFYVGRIDFAILFTVILAPICLKRVLRNDGEKC